MTEVVNKDMFKLGQEHKVALGASFAPSAWIMPVVCGHLYGVGWVTTDLAQLQKDEGAGLQTMLSDVDSETGKPWMEVLRDEDGNLFDEQRASRNGNKFQYYYRDYDRALALARLLNEEEPAYSSSGEPFDRRPSHFFRIEGMIQNVLSLTDESKEKFETDVKKWEVELKAPRKNSKTWFKWHGLTLPSLVASYAKLMGWKITDFDLGELLKPEDEVIVTDVFQETMVGNKDVGIDGSKLAVRRRLMWQQLGEDNWKASNPSDTNSNQLKAALEVATRDWGNAIYCKIVPVPSPLVGDSYEGAQGTKQSPVPVFLEFYRDQETAQAAANELLAQRGGSDEDAQAAPATTGPRVPEAWSTIPDDWLAEVAKLKKEIGVKPLPVVKKMLNDRAEQLASDLMATPDDVLASWNEV